MASLAPRAQTLYDKEADMTPISELAVVCGLTALGLAFWFVPAYRKYRGGRTVTCPETRTEALVEVDSVRFAATSLSSRPSLRLSACSRWAQGVRCEQDCLSQIRA